VFQSTAKLSALFINCESCPQEKFVKFFTLFAPEERGRPARRFICVLLKCSNQASISALFAAWCLELFSVACFHAPVFRPEIGFKLGFFWLYLGLNGFVFYRQNHRFDPLK